MPPYRRRYRRYGYRRRRRFYRRRFGIGGGDRKPPSSYSQAYGFIKHFFSTYAKFVSTLAEKHANGPALYAQPEILSLCARLFIQEDLPEDDIKYIYSIQLKAANSNTALTTDILNYFVSFYLLPIKTHVKDFQSVVNSLPTAEYDAGTKEAPVKIKSFARNALFTSEQANSTQALLIALKSRIKNLIQGLTKRKLPFSLALSEWCYEYLKAKRRLNKSVYFWRFKSVPRYMVLLTISIANLWMSTRYAPRLLKYLTELNFVRNPTSPYRLKKLLEAKDEKALAEQALAHREKLDIAPLAVNSDFAKDINY